MSVTYTIHLIQEIFSFKWIFISENFTHFAISNLYKLNSVSYTYNRSFINAFLAWDIPQEKKADIWLPKWRGIGMGGGGGRVTYLQILAIKLFHTHEILMNNFVFNV